MVSSPWPAGCGGRHCALSMFLVLGQILTCGCSWRMRELAVLSKGCEGEWLKAVKNTIKQQKARIMLILPDYCVTMGNVFLHLSRWTCHCRRTLYTSRFLINTSAMLEADVPKMSSSGWQDGTIWKIRVPPSLLMTFVVCDLECVLRQEKHNINSTSGVGNEHMINLGCSAESDVLTGLRRLRISTPWWTINVIWLHPRKQRKEHQFQ